MFLFGHIHVHTIFFFFVGGGGGDVRPASGPEPNWFDDWEQNGLIEIFYFLFFLALVMRNGFVQIKSGVGCKAWAQWARAQLVRQLGAKRTN
jgi:hypothetical protein